MSGVDWQAWHEEYDDPGSDLARRLLVVQEQIHEILAAVPPGPITVVSVCAGEGRDLLGVLRDHPRRREVRARLVELDDRIAAVARDTATRLGLSGVEVVVGDAALTEHYVGMVPADVVLMCGVFGNITDEDIAQTIGYARQLCRRDGFLVWTRHRNPPDLVPQICQWLDEQGFEQRWLSEPGVGYGVGVHRFRGEPLPLARGERMFTFIGRDVLAADGVPNGLERAPERDLTTDDS